MSNVENNIRLVICYFGCCFKDTTDLCATVEVVKDESGVLNGIFSQDKPIAKFDKYPEVLLIGATYKLNDLRLSLFVLMCVDANGESEITGLWIVSDESKDTIQNMMQIFKKYNQKWENVKCIMSDKDMNERDTLCLELPSAVIQICLFHVLKTFKREITCEKLKISADELLHALELLQKLTYSKSETSYFELYAELKDTHLHRVLEYYGKNWHSIKEQWVEGYKTNVCNMPNRTGWRSNVTITTTPRRRRMRVQSGQDKYRRALDLGQKKTAIIAEKSFKDFNHHIKNLEILIELLQQSKPYAITEVFVDDIEGATLQLNQDIIITSNVNTDAERSRQNPSDELNQETHQEHVDEARPDLIEDIGFNLRLPPKIVKRGRPKGTEVIVIGLPQKKRSARVIPFLKRAPKEKEKAILSLILRDENGTLDDIISDKTKADANNLLDDSRNPSLLMKINPCLQIISTLREFSLRDPWLPIGKQYVTSSAIGQSEV
ncbi:unnamed protein product [Mytilus coruscus]|uniref:ZSWIM1/3 RNaseH-like domain-containing protein n=1 Tax=Mytilus coruscus TaxID=42192 RepID=A0A6J8ENS6_MYTCO|nr:unnamed protein product [Mytilus coruscus]